MHDLYIDTILRMHPACYRHSTVYTCECMTTPLLLNNQHTYLLVSKLPQGVISGMQ